MKDLKTCDFCGSKPKAIEDINHECIIYCTCPVGPFIIMRSDMFEKAKEIWNTRVYPDPKKERGMSDFKSLETVYKNPESNKKNKWDISNF